MGDIQTVKPAKKPEMAWHRHPALVTGIGAGIAAVATVIGSLLTVGLGQAGALPEKYNPAPAPTTVSVTATATATVTTTAPPNDSTTLTSAAPLGGGQIVWKRKVHLPSKFGLDIDNAQPSVTYLGPQNEFRTAADGEDSPQFWARGLKGTASSATTTYAQCVDALNTAALADNFPTPVGTTICIRSNAAIQHLALVRVVAWNKKTHDMDAEVTVWTTE
jgi:hypothetical protein